MNDRVAAKPAAGDALRDVVLQMLAAEATSCELTVIVGDIRAKLHVTLASVEYPYDRAEAPE